MSSILIVGNVVKDVYLQLDERAHKLEHDQDGHAWMDIAFNKSTYNYLRRTSVFAGAVVTLEVLESFGLEASIAGCDLKLKDGELTERCNTNDYRYILCQDDEIAYLTASERPITAWQAPEKSPKWVFVDRSATISSELAQNITAYLELSGAKLAIYLDSKELNAAEQQLANQATIVFCEHKLSQVVQDKCCIIHNDTIKLGKHRVRWQREKSGLMTHLTMHSIVAASIFGALINRKSVTEALALARINVENATLNGTVKYHKLEEMMEQKSNNKFLREMAATLVAPGKGILAADESGGSIHKKFENAGIPDDEEHRRDYRNIFFTTPGLEKYVNGVILFDETARQKADDGRDFVSYLTALGIVPGIKVDQGLEDFDPADGAQPGEKWTKGLDDLPKRLAEYYEMGLRFAKWRAALEITFDESGKRLTPSDVAIKRNAEILAQYALDCQDAGIVPIVEPELVYDGDYGMDVAKEVNGKIFDALFKELAATGVDLAGCILKCSMTLAGKRFALGPQSTPAEVGEATAEVLRAHVPAELAGVVFLSGGQSVEQATDNLQAVTNNGPFPWPVTFSFARALQDPALDAWQGNNTQADTARKAFGARLAANCNALKKQ